eukprot:g1725.t1
MEASLVHKMPSRRRSIRRTTESNSSGLLRPNPLGLLTPKFAKDAGPKATTPAAMAFVPPQVRKKGRVVSTAFAWSDRDPCCSLRRLQNTEDSGSDFHDLPEPELPKGLGKRCLKASVGAGTLKRPQDGHGVVLRCRPCPAEWTSYLDPQGLLRFDLGDGAWPQWLHAAVRTLRLYECAEFQGPEMEPVQLTLVEWQLRCDLFEDGTAIKSVLQRPEDRRRVPFSVAAFIILVTSAPLSALSARKPAMGCAQSGAKAATSDGKSGGVTAVDKQQAKEENKKYEETMSFLSQVPLFMRLPKDQHPILAAACVNQPFKAGQTIITQGETGREFFIIQSGEAEVSVNDGGSQKKAHTVTNRAGGRGCWWEAPAGGEAALRQDGDGETTHGDGVEEE